MQCKSTDKALIRKHKAKAIYMCILRTICPYIPLGTDTWPLTLLLDTTHFTREYVHTSLYVQKRHISSRSPLQYDWVSFDTRLGLFWHYIPLRTDTATYTCTLGTVCTYIPLRLAGLGGWPGGVQDTLQRATRHEDRHSRPRIHLQGARK